MDKLKKTLNIDEKFTKRLKEQKVYNKVKASVPLIEHYNYMCDLLFLPTDEKTKDKYLFVIVDLANDEFDIEPIKNKDAQTVLNAMLKIFKRKYIKKPYSSLVTDSGNEFKGVFHKYLYDNSIYQKTTIPGRHKQTANVERLNRTLGSLINGYLNSKEEETGKPYTNWVSIIPTIREQLNKIREKKLPKDLTSYIYPSTFDNRGKHIKTKTKDYYEEIKPKFNVGDIVHYKLDEPVNAFSIKQNTKKFREGDYRLSKDSLPITKIIYMDTEPYFRYILKDKKYVSYSENELKKSVDNVEKYIIKNIVDKKTFKGEIFYKIRWRGYLAKDDTWVSKKSLIEDGLDKFVKSYENN